MLLREVIIQEKGLNCMISHNFLHSSFRNLICSLKCIMQLLFLFVFWTCLLLLLLKVGLFFFFPSPLREQVIETLFSF